MSQVDDCNSESIDMNAISDTDDTIDFMQKRQLCKGRKKNLSRDIFITVQFDLKSACVYNGLLF